MPPHTVENAGGGEFIAVQVEMKDAGVENLHSLKFRRLPDSYVIVRLAPDAVVPEWATKGDFTSISRTSDELSIVCAASNIPEGVDPGPRWACLKLEGPFPFSQTGVLLSFIGPLSNNGVPIFAVSTYDTDYVLIQANFLEAALKLLQAAGHELWGRGTNPGAS